MTKEEKKAYNANYHLKHKIEILAQKAAYYLVHREEIRPKRADHYLSHIEEKRAYDYEYYFNNKELVIYKALLRKRHKKFPDKSPYTHIPTPKTKQ